MEDTEKKVTGPQASTGMKTNVLKVKPQRQTKVRGKKV